MRIGRLAKWYRWIEYAAFGGALERRRFAFLPRLASATRVLVLGEGDGRTIARLCRLAPGAFVDVIELSPEMIALARRRAEGSANVAFRCGDAREANWPDGSYDGIVTNFFLDCFPEEDARILIRRLSNALAPGGIWLISEFTVPTSGWRRLHAKVWIETMYRFFGLATGLRVTALPPIEKLMPDAGMQLAARESARAGLMVSEVWIHAPGSTPGPSAGSRTSL